MDISEMAWKVRGITWLHPGDPPLPRSAFSLCCLLASLQQHPLFFPPKMNFYAMILIQSRQSWTKTWLLGNVIIWCLLDEYLKSIIQHLFNGGSCNWKNNCYSSHKDIWKKQEQYMFYWLHKKAGDSWHMFLMYFVMFGWIFMGCWAILILNIVLMQDTLCLS